MTFNQAFSIRVRELLKEKHLTQYKLESLTGIHHSTMSAILNNRVKISNFKNIAIIIMALDMSLSEFFDHPLFDFENIDLDS